MKSSCEHLVNNCLAMAASFFVSATIMVVGFHYSLGLISIILAPLTAGSLAAYMVLLATEEGSILYLIETFWYTLLLGATVSLLVALFFVFARTQNYLYLTDLSV